MIRINKLKNTKKALLAIVFAGLALYSPAFAIEEISKKIELKENHSHLLSFDEKIIRYKAGVEGVFDIEILPDIYNQRHEIFIRPLKPADTNIMVWTKTQIYNFDIVVKANANATEGFNIFEIDLPPGLE